MAFDSSAITDMNIRSLGSEIRITWTSTAPDGTWFQIYLGGRFAWRGTRRTVVLPKPYERMSVNVGAVGAGEAQTNFASSLPSAPTDRAVLTWQGGTFLSDSIASFAIYRSPTPGAAVSYASPIATVTAYRGSITDGYGFGAYGAGAYGQAAGDYSWTSPPLAPGTWSFAVVAIDQAGNPSSSPATTTVTITGPPRPPASSRTGSRLNYSLNTTTRVATLSWLASPA